MKWTRKDREVWYLAVVFLVSFALALPAMNVWLFVFDFDILDSLLEMLLEPLFEILSPSVPLPIFLFVHVIIFFLLPGLSHLPAYVYGIYTWDNADRGYPWHYLLALSVSETVSFFLMFLRVPLSPSIPPSWQIEVSFVFIILLVPTFHAYFEYNKYGDIREVVLLLMIYAPWLWLVRMFLGYVRFL